MSNIFNNMDEALLEDIGYKLGQLFDFKHQTSSVYLKVMNFPLKAVFHFGVFDVSYSYLT